MKKGREYFFYHNDHLGTPQKMTAVNGAVVWSAKYLAFGEALIDPAIAVENNLRFAGQYADGETGYHYNWQRYYDPGTGRYLTPDPIELAGGINLFVYSENNPLNYIDPLGLFNTRLFVSSSIGFVVNGFGIISGGLALSAPTGVTQVLGGVVLAKSSVGIFLPAKNIYKSFKDESALPSSAFGLLACTVTVLT